MDFNISIVPPISNRSMVRDSTHVIVDDTITVRLGVLWRSLVLESCSRIKIDLLSAHSENYASVVECLFDLRLLITVATDELPQPDQIILTCRHGGICGFGS